MRPDRQLNITLPSPMADAVQARVASGDYASESEVIREGLRALNARERATDDWLRGPVAAEYDSWAVGTLETVTLDDVRREFAAGSER